MLPDKGVTYEVVHVPQRLDAGHGWTSVRCKCGGFLMEACDDKGLEEAQAAWVAHMEQVWEMLKENPEIGSTEQ